MLGYRKRSFFRAHDLLSTLRSDKSNIGALREMQALLLGEIIRTEERIRLLKSELKSIDPEAPNATEAQIKRLVFLTNRVEGLRRCAFIWRSFGDAIAFLYMDKYALKQTVYNVDNYNQKQSAGFVSGKDGLGAELTVLDGYLNKGIPALLVDITNTIRHGDICVMLGPDPMLVEVKASEGRINPRGRKQGRGLAMLNTLFQTDEAKGLRGMQEVRRRELKVAERSYLPLMNACIAKAMEDGYKLERPENGIVYVAMGNHAPPIEDIFADLGLRSILVFGWNTAKAQQTWVPFIPFTLSIENKDALWAFVEGKVFVLVVVEIETLIEIAKDSGLDATYDAELDPQYPLKFELDEEGSGLSGISSQMIARIGMECVSAETLIRGSIETYHDLNHAFPNTDPA